MKNRLVLGVMIAMLATGVGRARGDGWDAPPPDADGSAALAARLDTFAHQTLHTQKLPPYALDMSAALYRAAVRLDPNNPQYVRSLADNLLESSDGVGAIEALSQYRKLEPDDQTAQIQQIDLYLASEAMQSADQRLSYLRGLLQKQLIPPEVRSEVALRCARIYEQRAQSDQVLKMLGSALELNPVNLEALRTKYAMTRATSLPVDRVTQLLAILQANPTDPVVASRMAEQLAQLGLVPQAITWYTAAQRLYMQTGQRPDSAFALGAASELLIGNRPQDAANLIGAYLKAFSGDADGWFLALAITKYQVSQDPKDQVLAATNAAELHQAAIALTNRLQAARRAAGISGATTQPIDSPTEQVLGDISDDAGRLNAAGNREVTSEYETAAASLAWFELYYRRDKVAADALLDVLAKLLPAKDVELMRLQAWRQYLEGESDAAMAKFQALGDKDPLASLGAVLVDLSASSKHALAMARGRKLLDEYPSGVIGAVLSCEIRPSGVAVRPLPNAAPVAALIDAVPGLFMNLGTDPQSFYVIHADPVKASYEYGEPIVVRVGVTNISNEDITVADDGALHPELWFDAFLHGTLEQGITGAAVGRLDQRLVLAPGQNVSTLLRVDQDALYGVFYQNPNLALTVNLTVVTNPTDIRAAGAGAPAQARPGLCGYSEPLMRMIQQDPVPISTDDQREQLAQQMAASDGGTRIRAMQAAAFYVGSLRQKTDSAAVATTIFSHLRTQDMSDTPCVEAWRQYLLAKLSSGDETASDLSAMYQDANWQSRLLALVAVQHSGQDAAAPASQLSTDKDPIVSAYAKALAKSIAASAAQPGGAASPETPTDTPRTGP